MKKIGSIRSEVAQAVPLYIRHRELMTWLPFSSATLWRKVGNGTFVKPVKLSQKITAWNRAEVKAWLDAKEAL